MSQQGRNPHSYDVGRSGELGSLCVWRAEADDDASGCVWMEASHLS